MNDWLECWKKYAVFFGAIRTERILDVHPDQLYHFCDIECVHTATQLWLFACSTVAVLERGRQAIPRYWQKRQVLRLLHCADICLSRSMGDKA